MIKTIISLLPIVTDETENIRIAKGKYKLAENLKEAKRQIKNQIKWQSKKQ